jgi:hypothetical protein
MPPLHPGDTFPQLTLNIPSRPLGGVVSAGRFELARKSAGSPCAMLPETTCARWTCLAGRATARVWRCEASTHTARAPSRKQGQNAAIGASARNPIGLSREARIRR